LNIIGHCYPTTSAALSTDFYRQKRRSVVRFAMVRSPQTPVTETVLPVLPPLPGWARIEPPVTDDDADSGAAFQAGAALAMLDGRARAGVPFDGAWRRRLALQSAAASARIARRGEDEAMLRDAFLLRHGGDRNWVAMLILLNESSRSNTSHDRFTQVDAESILSALTSTTITGVALLEAWGSVLQLWLMQLHRECR
jgi:hypothetical protein